MFGPRKRLEIVLPCFGAHLPDISHELQEQNVYPLATRTPDGFDLDYSSLLFTDGIIIDRTSYDYIRDNRRAHFAVMRSSVEQLQDAGYLRVVDYEQTIKPFHAEIRQRVDELLEVPESWLSTARTHWRIYRQEIPELVRRFGSQANHEIEHMHFGVYCYLRQCSDHLNRAEARRLHALLECRKKRLTPAEREDFREIVRPMLSHVVVMQLLRQQLGQPSLDWSDLLVYYRRIERPAWIDRNPEIHSAPTMIESTRQLFTVAMPELRPNCVRQVLGFIKTRQAVRSLREELLRCLHEGTVLDSQWAASVRDDANRAQISARGRQRVISWIANALGWIPVPAVSQLAQTAVAIGHDLVVDCISDRAEHNSLRKYAWYYALLSAQGL